MENKEILKTAKDFLNCISAKHVQGMYANVCYSSHFINVPYKGCCQLKLNISQIYDDG